MPIKVFRKIEVERCVCLHAYVVMRRGVKMSKYKANDITTTTRKDICVIMKIISNIF